MLPQISVIAHPECSPEVLEQADYVGSTHGIVNWVRELRPPQVMMLTECSMADNVAYELDDVEIMRPCNLCPHMKKITLENIRNSLRTMTHEVVLESEIAARARLAVERMLRWAAADPFGRPSSPPGAGLLRRSGRRGDLTSAAVIDEGWEGVGSVVFKSEGRVAGLGVAEKAFGFVDSDVVFEAKTRDGADLAPGSVAAEVRGPARGILVAERVALNLLGHLSGVATATRQLVEAVSGTGVKITDTRKTTPGLRMLRKRPYGSGVGESPDGPVGCGADQGQPSLHGG